MTSGKLRRSKTPPVDPEGPCFYTTYEQTYGLKCLVLALEAILVVCDVTRMGHGNGNLIGANWVAKLTSKERTRSGMAMFIYDL